MGYIDIHCHLLWDLDDGCNTAGEMLGVARALVGLGYTDVAPSPHVQERYAGGDARRARERLEEARALLAREGVALRLHPGGENLLDDHFLARAGVGDARCVGDRGRYVLVEAPFQEYVPDLPARVRAVQSHGIVPLIAHPERCMEFAQRGRAEEVVQTGARLQLNLGSLTGRHGGHARLLAERFLEKGLYAVAATDLHAPEGAETWIDEALRALAAMAGDDQLRRLCEENPRRVLAGEDLE